MEEIIKEIALSNYNFTFDGISNLFEKKELILNTPEVLWLNMYKKSLFLENNIKMPEITCEDTAVIPMLLLKAKKVCRIDENLYKNLEKIVSREVTYTQMDSVSMKKIEKLKEQGFLKGCNTNVEIKHAAADQIDDYMKNNVHQLILQVTQNCNLRCKYCVYSGSYVNRVHTKKRMSIETAKKAVDFCD